MHRALRAIKWLMASTGLMVVAFIGMLGYGLSSAEVMELFTGLPTPIRLAQAAAAGVLVSTVALAATTVVHARQHALPRRVTSGATSVIATGAAIRLWALMWAVLPV